MTRFTGKTPNPAPSHDDAYLVPGLIRGLKVLQVFRADTPALSLSEIARALDLTRSAAFRSVYTLTHLGFLLHDAQSQTYRPGPAIMALGRPKASERELLEAARPELKALVAETGWASHLGVRRGGQVVYLMRVAPREDEPGRVQVGSRLPTVTTAMGRMLLTNLDEEGLSHILRDPHVRTQAQSRRQGLAGVRAQWAQDRESGAVIQTGQFDPEITSIAAPLRDGTGEIVAAINVARLTPAANDMAQTEILAIVRACARRISLALGYWGDDGAALETP